ncbi:hypothetical protein BEL04_22290 [Mucilaginibacter sp. PPCGB 2223]|uniref:DUF4199 domain-containing protein n=1 Tax=Mucilaginibacter sp. PPCGB 2223 TaxID=1886027 RepID=UPI000824878C|nr:DUF4199 domain-containing protein [Mucilaginibacter sp. PPCGB 2223]OCX50509.1 hypothetical protein BEL04_22290 [Mucilaginibacter sp. PPCGB 2223]
MKNALIYGAVIGALSGIWIFVMHLAGISTKPTTEFQPIEITSVIIPLVVLYIGVRSYRENEMGGRITFLEALIEGWKILLVGGVIAIFFAILFINYVTAGSITAFSAQIFGALLVGLLSSLAVSLLIMSRSKNL